MRLHNSRALRATPLYPTMSNPRAKHSAIGHDVEIDPPLSTRTATHDRRMCELHGEWAICKVGTILDRREPARSVPGVARSSLEDRELDAAVRVGLMVVAGRGLEIRLAVPGNAQLLRVDAFHLFEVPGGGLRAALRQQDVVLVRRGSAGVAGHRADRILVGVAQVGERVELGLGGRVPVKVA